MNHMNFTMPELETIAKLQALAIANAMEVYGGVQVNASLLKMLNNAALQDLMNRGCIRQIETFDKLVGV